MVCWLKLAAPLKVVIGTLERQLAYPQIFHYVIEKTNVALDSRANDAIFRHDAKCNLTTPI